MKMVLNKLIEISIFIGLKQNANYRFISQRLPQPLSSNRITKIFPISSIEIISSISNYCFSPHWCTSSWWLHCRRSCDWASSRSERDRGLFRFPIRILTRVGIRWSGGFRLRPEFRRRRSHSSTSELVGQPFAEIILIKRVVFNESSNWFWIHFF